MSDFSSCALGSFGCPPFVAIALAQPNRAAEESYIKSRGTSLTLFDAAEVSSIERDSFIVLGVYSDAELKGNQSLVYKVLKNRDKEVDVSTVTTVFIPQHCFVGDTLEKQQTISYSQEDAKAMLDL
jgi:hypothetical protein